MRIFLTVLLAAGCAWAQATMPMTGKAVPELAVYENALKPIMQKWSIPGAALAITDKGRLVYARGIGYADREAGIPVQPGSLFRFASISKTLTGMTILKLAEEGRLSLDAKFMDLIPNITPIPGFNFDARMRNVTVRQLLQHTGGFDKDIPDDWVLQFTAASRALGVPYASLTPDLLCRYAISQRLDFDPGTRYSYNQSGYLFLGRIVEKITGKKYEDAVREKLLSPAGVTTIKLGHSLLSQKEPDEVKYYNYPGAPLMSPVVVPGAVAPAPRPYGAYWVEMADAYGGWIGNAIDLMKYINALEGRRGPAILNAASLAAIVARPAPPVTPTGNYVGLTWRITPITVGQHWWHSGGATGTRNILARRENNRDWVVLMNSRPEDEDTIITEIFNAFSAAEPKVTSWPTNDLFADFGGPTLSTGAQSLAFTHSYGSAAPEAQTLQVTAAPGTVNFTITQPAARWLRVDRLSGVTPAAIGVSVDPAGLDPGDYQGLIAIAAPQSANGARAIQVSLRVAPTPGFTVMRNSASLLPVQSAAPESRLIIESQDLAATSAKTDGIPAPGPLNGVTVRITDSASVEAPVAIVELSPARIDLVLPPGLQPGEASIAVTTSKGRLLRDRLQIEAVTPALFSANGDGTGAPLAALVRVAEDGTATSEPGYDCSGGPGACTPVPIDLGLETDTVSLQLAATGVRSQTDPAAFAARIGDENAQITAIQPSSTAAGVDLVTVRLPRTLAGRGDLDLTLAVADKTSNAVKINVK